LKVFLSLLKENDEVKALAAKVHAFAVQFPIPGFEPSTMKYQNPNGPHA
jgi:hypothetical protein